MNQTLSDLQLKYNKLHSSLDNLHEELVIANQELAFQNTKKEQRAAELVIANQELAFQNNEKEQRAAELVIANQELAFQNTKKEQRAAALVIANQELAFQNTKKEQRAAELVIANQELAFQSDEKEQRAAELVIANQELAFQNNEKERRAAELVIANQELAFQNNEKEQRAAELVIANQELAFQNNEKERRAAELVIANQELAFQNNEKEQRAAELVIVNQELAFHNAEKEWWAAELVIANQELAFQNNEKEQRTAALVIANQELAFQNDEKEKRTAALIIANQELAFQNGEKEQRAAALVITNKHIRVAATVFESKDGIMVTNAKCEILRVNSAFTHITGYSSEEAIGKNLSFLSSGCHDVNFYVLMWESINRTGVWKGEVSNRHKNNEIFSKYIIITAVKDLDGSVMNYVATFNDITVSKAAMAKIERLSFYDSLTDLPNRRLLRDRLNRVLAESHYSGRKAALLFIDLDNFKNLNDTLGHDMGDLLLQQVAQRLTACVREADTVARLGGDEFVILLPNLSKKNSEASAQTGVIGHKILSHLNQPYQLVTHDYSSSPSIGATVFSHEGEVTDELLNELLKQADIAMYAAKTSGRNTLCFFDPQMQANITARVILESDLRQALAKKQFILYYQIQISDNGSAIGAEALIRWQHPQKGLIFPDSFIPLAEETGLIVDIGLWVLEMACTQLKHWEDCPHTKNLLLSINVSAKQFYQPDFVARVCQILSDSAIKTELLKFELTESLVLNDVNETIVKMKELKEIGVRFSMDDFGTGYSSLSYLTRLPFNQLKIDQSFVRNIGVKPSDATIVKTIIGMAHNLGMEVIAEGVETEAQRKFLEQHDCLLYQGYLFSKPVPIEQFEALLTFGAGLN
ncbi:MAG: EAL domain-containing protein [Methylococcales bacterium]|nr:EAL domain-containing protein [Methylococcales bacterium]